MIRFSLNADIGCNSDGETNPADTSVAENDGKTFVILCESWVDLLFC